MTVDSDFIPELCGKPGDPPPPAGRENFSRQALNAYLDTAGGQAQIAVYGSRQGAADAMQDAEAANRAWRRAQAVPRAEAFPGRFPSVDDAANALSDPVGGF